MYSPCFTHQLISVSHLSLGLQLQSKLSNEESQSYQQKGEPSALFTFVNLFFLHSASANTLSPGFPVEYVC